MEYIPESCKSLLKARNVVCDAFQSVIDINYHAGRAKAHTGRAARPSLQDTATDQQRAAIRSDAATLGAIAKHRIISML